MTNSSEPVAVPSLLTHEVSGDTSANLFPATDSVQESQLWNRSFVGLLAAQALGTVNDNIFRWMVVGLALKFATSASHQSMLIGIGTICLTLPFLVFAAPAGFLADRFAKSRIVAGAKFLEIVVMLAGAIAIWSALATGELYSVFIVLFFMGAQSALYSPARMASLPEMLPERLISKANGWFGLTTLVSVIVGTGIGNYLADLLKGPGGESYLWLCAGVILGVAAVGWGFSLLISYRPPGNPQLDFSWNFINTTWQDLKLLYANKALWRVAMGIMFFWSLAAMSNQNVDQLVKEGAPAGAIRYADDFAARNAAATNTETTPVASTTTPETKQYITQSDNTPFLICLTLGVGIGSLLAGYWSGNRVELGILPLGAIGVIFTTLLLWFCGGSLFVLVDGVLQITVWHVVTCGLLFLLGASAGLFDIPLEAYMQEYSPRQNRGSLLAANNFLSFSGIIGVSLLYMLLRSELGATVTRPDGTIGREPLFSAQTIFLLCGLVTIPVLYYIVKLIPQAAVRFVVWLVTSVLYRIKLTGAENIPASGPVLLTSNHVSWLDAVVIILTCPRPIRMFAWAGNFENKLMRTLAEQWGVILVTANPKSIIRALKTANEALKNGEVVCLFPEGEISRTGNLQTFKPGMMKILDGTNAPVVPVYLDQLWGSIFSFDDGKFFWKWPRQWPYPVGVHYGAALLNVTDISQTRNAVLRLGAQAVRERTQARTSIGYEGLIGCFRKKFRPKFSDTTGASLTGAATVTRALILRRVLRRILGPAEKTIGVLLPPTVPAAVTNFSLVLDRRVISNLNYTCTAEILNSCLEQAGIQTVITSQKFLDKMDLKLQGRMILLEDVKGMVTTWDKVVAALQTWLLPKSVLAWWLGILRTPGSDPLTIIFTSGSTGKPKGVVLTHGNVKANVEAIDQVIHLQSEDVLLGILPLFHALGSTVTLWAGLLLNLKVAYHFSPLDAKQVGKLCREAGGTVLLTTPTFLRSYIRRCEAADFATLNTVITGAERLPQDVADAFEEKFHVRPVEGYGTTELAPLASVNIPPSRSVKGFHSNRKEGTVGRPVPGVCAEIRDPETRAPRACGEDGLLWISGGNVMEGYLHRRDLTDQVLVDGWYCTGDMARLDEEGFIQITGRLSRFSKIGGEMVPHGAVEEELLKAVGAGDAEQQPLAVSAVPDEKKGERLIVLHTGLNRTPAELAKALTEAGLPNLYIPGNDCYYQVDSLPILGTGKLDLAGIKKMAEQLAG
ncbi:MAG: MFS transporter [Pirellulales bacterium]|nr:MFS transporter [Pirellulales bacterium]